MFDVICLKFINLSIELFMRYLSSKSQLKNENFFELDNIIDKSVYSQMLLTKKRLNNARKIVCNRLINWVLQFH